LTPSVRSHTPEAPVPPDPPGPSIQERVTVSAVNGVRGGLEAAAMAWLLKHGSMNNIGGMVSGACGLGLGMAIASELLNDDSGPSTPQAKLLALGAGVVSGAIANYTGMPAFASAGVAGFAAYAAGYFAGHSGTPDSQ
jgi:hypothetical protein